MAIQRQLSAWIWDIDQRQIAARPIYGVSRYILEVLKRCPASDYTTARPRASRLPGYDLIWEQAVLPRQMLDHDLLWSPGQHRPAGGGQPGGTIHDLAYLEHPEWFTAGHRIFYRAVQPRLARRVRRVITDSTYSDRRIVSLLGIPRKGCDDPIRDWGGILSAAREKKSNGSKRNMPCKNLIC